MCCRCSMSPQDPRVPQVLQARGTYGWCSWPRSIPSACSRTRTLPGRPSHTPLGAGRGNNNRDPLRRERERDITIQPQCHRVRWLPAARRVTLTRTQPSRVQLKGMHPGGVTLRRGALMPATSVNPAPKPGVNDELRGDSRRVLQEPSTVLAIATSCLQ